MSRVLEKLGNVEVIGFDTESSGPLLPTEKMINVHRSTLTGFSISFPDKETVYAPVRHLRENLPFSDCSQMLEAISRFKGRVAIHNAKHDLRVLEIAGHSAPLRWECTQIRAFLANVRDSSYKLNLKGLTKDVLGVAERKTFKEVSNGNAWEALTPSDPNVLAYACHDAEDHLNLFLHIGELPESTEKWYQEVERPFLRLIMTIESRGMGIDKEKLLALHGEMQGRIQQVMDDWDFYFSNILISSPKQLREYFYPDHWYEELSIPTKTGQLGTEAKVLAAHAKRAPTALGQMAAELKIQYNVADKIRSTYSKRLVEFADQHPDGRLHGSFNQTGTVTGRLSSSDPNLQNIPTRTELGKRVKCQVPPARVVHEEASSG